MKYKNPHTQPSTSSLKIFLSFSCSHTVLCSLSNMPSTQALGVFALFFLVWNVLPLPSSPRLTITLGDKAFLTTCPFLHPSLSPTLLYFALHTKFQFTCYTVISLSQSFRTKCMSQERQKVHLIFSWLDSQQLSSHGRHSVNICRSMNLLCKWRD